MKKWHKLALVILGKAMSSVGTLAFQFFLLSAYSLDYVGKFNASIALIMGGAVFVRQGLDILVLREASHMWRAGERDKIYSLARGAVRKLLLGAFCLAIMFIVLGEEGLGLLAIKFSYALALLPLVFSLLLICGALYKSTDHPVLSCLSEPGQVFLWSAVIAASAHALGLGELEPILLLVIVSVILVAASSANLWKEFRKGATLLDVGTNINFRIFAITILNYLSQWGVVLLIGGLYNDSSAALFFTALRIAFVMNFISMVANHFLTPQISFLHKKNRIGDMENVVRKNAAIVSVVGAGAILVVILVLQSNLLPDEVGSNEKLAIIFLLGQWINISCGATSYLLNLTGHEDVLLKSTAFAVLLGYSGIVLVAVGGASIVYAAMGYLIIPITVNLLAVISIRRSLGFWSLPRILPRISK